MNTTRRRFIHGNQNRFHAIEQIRKSLKAYKIDADTEDIPLDTHIGEGYGYAAIANALIYVGDGIEEIIKLMKEEETVNGG